ncbi:GntR family transcriptional regulator [Halomonas sp. McH1-25]|uniref:GntR family transcriptional regulator n=1 Tax=unclassified Halomonas TaxID=2609666 RepID=UPI001EF5D4D3|nr:GntR family transcriptional regulator [Halomonas sp. McH1-25]MCP1343270.1 GntR family transcriptional regulator [Halomonas sp. FL8]MCP1360739.1 GntR family transcriptional regulator [Halomonas sp. BBD45]MCP1366307.1 GntR family transcriptional regulator [Halomonas sp. BBD48]
MSKSNTSVAASLRKLISEGRYPPGERIAELHVAEQLGVSRTPIRLAFRTLEQEGLLQRAGKRGYRVREFTETDVLCALEVRGVLEGLAARRLAEQGMTEETDTRLAQCIEDGRELLTKGYLDRDDVTRWSEINEVFHTTIIESTGSLVIADAIGRNNHLPFASADSIILDTEALDREYRKLYFAQMQHRTVFQALRLGEGARAEMLMREHAYIGMRYGELLDLDPAGTLPS